MAFLLGFAGLPLSAVYFLPVSVFAGHAAINQSIQLTPNVND